MPVPPLDTEVTALNEAESLSRSILEPIHGLVRLSDDEVGVVDHALFQRLRKIKQNGLLYLVFPAATHTRFEHSLGALFVANAMLESLWFNSSVGATKGTVRSLAAAGPGDAIVLSEAVPIDCVRRVARLAALAHDMGHGPLSHTFDSFAPTREALAAVLKDRRLTALMPLREVLLRWDLDEDEKTAPLSTQRVPHEVMSCVLFAYVWQERQGDEETAQWVASAILGEDAIAQVSDLSAREWLPLVHDMIASAPADADRMDYLERDSRSIGVTYGLFDRNRVLKSLVCYQSVVAGRKAFRLGLKASGVAAIENLMQARFELFVQVYYHKTNRAISLMLDEIAHAARDAKLTLFTKPELDDWVRAYLELSDDVFVRLLRGADATLLNVTDEIKAIADEIDARRLWKRIYDYRKKEDAEQIASQLRVEFQDAPICVDKIRPKATKDLDKGAMLLERDANGVYSVDHNRAWLDAPIIRAMQEAEDSFVRIYLKKDDAALAKLLRNRARQLELDKERQHGS